MSVFYSLNIFLKLLIKYYRICLVLAFFQIWEYYLIIQLISSSEENICCPLKYLLIKSEASELTTNDSLFVLLRFVQFDIWRGIDGGDLQGIYDYFLVIDDWFYM